MNLRSHLPAAGLVATMLLAPVASAAVVTYADWTSGSVGNPGAASGTVGGITVSYSGEVADFNLGGGGINYWARSSPPPYNNPSYNAYTGVPNMPPESDIIQLRGSAQTPTLNTLGFSQAVTDPIMLILSLGQGSIAVEYDFDRPFTILSSGNGHWGGNPAGSLTAQPGEVVRGLEGHGAIQFHGTFTTISWTASPYENWHGFTVGLVPEPGAAVAVTALLLAGFAGYRRVRRA